MDAFTTLTAIAAPLDVAKIDTGVIIPGRFLRLRRRPGEATYATAFLHDLRFDEEDRPRADFVLNDPRYAGAGILVTGPDFGCGSSREGAAYAVRDFGVRALIGSSFGDVFVGNCMQNGIVPVVLAPAHVQALLSQLRARPGSSLTVDLPNQVVVDTAKAKYPFEIDAIRKRRLLEGLDDVGVTLQSKAKIEAFERAYLTRRPWRSNTM